MPDTIDSLVRAHADRRRRQADGDRHRRPDHLRRAGRHDSRPGRGVHRRRSRQGQPRRADHAQLCAVGADRRGTDTHRRRTGAAEHAAAGARTRRATTRGLRAVPCGRAGVPRAPLPRRRGTATVDIACAARGLAGGRAARATPTAPSSTRSPKPSRPATRSRSCSRRAAAARPKACIHSHGNALGAVRSGLAARCIGPDTRLYLPMPFFWVGGFGSGVLSALLAGATLVTEQIPSRIPRCGCWRKSVSPCSAAGPIRPKRWHAKRIPSQSICRHCDPAAWRRCCPLSNEPSPGRGRGCSG